MRHRIFIAINLPEDIRTRLNEYQKKWFDLPCRWTKKDNLHITLLFLGYLSSEELLDVCRITKEAVQNHSAFTMKLERICYGPPKEKLPRMVWAISESNNTLGKLQNELEEKLFTSPVGGLKKESRAPSYHITIGRIKPWEFKRLEIEERPAINEEVNLSFQVDSVEVMESHLKKAGPEYIILESVPLE